MEAEKPELALLDLMLPGAHGVDLVQAILKIEDSPVVFISAYGREDLVARAFDMVADVYVVKPFSPTELAARIRAGAAAAGDRGAAGALRAGGFAHRPRRPPGDPGRQSGGPVASGVPAAGTGLGRAGQRRPEAPALQREQAAGQAGRRSRPSHLCVHRAPGGVLDAGGGN